MGKALATAARPDLQEYFEPVQIGVGTAGGAEAAVHTVRQWIGRNAGATDKVLITLDLENAFNTVDRTAFLKELRRIAPGIVPWVDFCYKSQSRLLLGPRQIISARGIQQGDPLGPALFSLAIHSAIVQAKNQVE